MHDAHLISRIVELRRLLQAERHTEQAVAVQLQERGNYPAAYVQRREHRAARLAVAVQQLLNAEQALADGGTACITSAT